MAPETKIVIPDSAKDRTLSIISTRSATNSDHYGFGLRSGFKSDRDRLPVVVVGWCRLGSAEQSAVRRINNFDNRRTRTRQLLGLEETIQIVLSRWVDRYQLRNIELYSSGSLKEDAQATRATVMTSCVESNLRLLCRLDLPAKWTRIGASIVLASAIDNLS